VTPATPRPQALSGQPAQAESGLDALADAVASSSGLHRGSLRSGGARVPAAAAPDPTVPADPPAPVEYARPAQQKKRPTAVIIGAAIVTAALLVAMGAMFFSTDATVNGPVVKLPAAAGNGGRNGSGGAVNPDGEGDEVPTPHGPHFCGIGLDDAPSVVYVLDRGGATAEMLDTLKEATYRSLESLKPSQKFAVIFWSVGGECVMYPDSGLADARPRAVQEAKQQFAEVYAGSRADPEDAVKAAAALRPGAIVLVTAKAFELDESFVNLTRDSLAGANAKVHTVALGSDDNTVLKKLSQSTGGEAKVVSKRELRGYSD
jgi:hypothetical protein